MTNIEQLWKDHMRLEKEAYVAYSAGDKEKYQQLDAQSTGKFKDWTDAMGKAGGDETEIEQSKQVNRKRRAHKKILFT